jgi:hypothetical protein
MLTLATGTALIGSLAMTSAAPVAADTTVSINTGSTWTAYSDAGLTTSLGAAEVVCLNSSYPNTGAYTAGCPAGATNFGWSGGAAWTANLGPISNAYFIWAPEVGPSSPTTMDSHVWFKTTFSVDGLVSADPTFYLAADNYAQVFVNGMAVGSVGSSSSGSDTGAFNNLSSFTVPKEDFPTGDNTIVIEAANALVGESISYSSNPAGVVFGTSLNVVAGSLTECSEGSTCSGSATDESGSTNVSVTGGAGGSGILSIGFGGSLQCSIPYLNKPYASTSATFSVDLTSGASKIFDLTLTKAAARAAHKPFAFQYFVCFNAPEQFTQLLGKPAPADPTNGGYTGLLPFCYFAPANNPCVQLEYNSRNGDVHIRFFAPAGDPHGYF